MAADNVTFQVNFKTPRGTLINLYAQDEAHLTGLLEALPTQAILEEEALLSAANNAAPLTVPQQTQSVPQQQGYQQNAPAPQAQSTQRLSPNQACEHGSYEWREFTSAKGNAIKGWFCQQKGSDCKPQFVR